MSETLVKPANQEDIEFSRDANEKTIKSKTKCWDCANACGLCSWSSRFVPVPGWNAIKIPLGKSVRMPSDDPEDQFTYIVKSCPLFHEDAWGYGTRRIPKEKPEETKKEEA